MSQTNFLQPLKGEIKKSAVIINPLRLALVYNNNLKGIFTIEREVIPSLFYRISYFNDKKNAFRKYKKMLKEIKKEIKRLI